MRGYLVVRKNSTDGPFIVEPAQPGWENSKADIGGRRSTFESASALARELNVAEDYSESEEDDILMDAMGLDED